MFFCRASFGGFLGLKTKLPVKLGARNLFSTSVFLKFCLSSFVFLSLLLGFSLVLCLLNLSVLLDFPFQSSGLFCNFLAFLAFLTFLFVFFRFSAKIFAGFLHWRMLHLPSLFHDLGVGKPPGCMQSRPPRIMNFFWSANFRTTVNLR